MTKSDTKAQRLLQIQALLLSHPEGLTQSDIAKRLNVNRSTIHRYLPELTTHFPVFEEDGRLFIERKSYLVNLQLNLYEALSLHLATRLLTNRIERHNPHSASLLRKLAETIEKLSPQISHHLNLSADIADDPSRFQDPHYLSVLETMALAWAEGRKVRIWHRHQETKKVYAYLFSVYFIEPYAVGYAIHAVGLREPPGSIRTFNLARIERIELTDQFYSIPKNFDPTELLKQAWGIWYTNNEKCEVKLLFSPQVADRVLETRWHPSQQTSREPDGSLIWEAEVAEPKEMIPWIRGWGSDCEVISPLFLRNRIINEIAALQRIYIANQGNDCFRFWAKFSKDDETHWHSLLWHMIDSAAVARLLWKDCLSESIKRSIASALDLSVEGAGKLLAFWVALHDIGKAGPEFQKKNPLHRAILEKLGFSFPVVRHGKMEGFHGTATTWILKRIFSADPSIPDNFGRSLAVTLGGHHGEFPRDQILNLPNLDTFHVGDEKWQQIQNELYDKLRQFLEAPTPKVFPSNHAEINSFLLLLAGFTTTADWIASNENYFPFLNGEMPFEAYYAIAMKQAETALKSLGWYGWRSVAEPDEFTKLFESFTPNPIQQTVIEASNELQSPFLMIIEAPTGSGKTEAALYLADTILQREEKSGLYIAMPTQATSNQMYERTANFLAHRYSDDKLNFHLVHGAALLQGKQSYIPTSIWGDEKPDFSNLQAQSWFLPRKRTLLAPFAVGTVDQTFLSVLQSRHFFLRLFGLSHKVLIFDEVHAYDIYMTEIFKTLLHWLHAVGTSVIILTATLPTSTRQELLHAYNGETLLLDDVPFPRISLAADHGSQVLQAGEVPSRTIGIKWIGPDAAEIAATLFEKLAGGGCAAVICNRVRRAQDIYYAVRAEFQNEEVEIILFHARFPYCWRQAIEKNVLSKFGKNTEDRPGRAIVIATQVIEQSLDLDFDLMVTDLAPVDLLIQRIGRLQRHRKRDHNRPSGLAQPTCIIAVPPYENGECPEFGSDGYVYEPYFLFRTLLALREKDSLLLPAETDDLIQAVYSPELPESGPETVRETLKAMQTEMRKKQAESQQNAQNFLVPLSNVGFLGSQESSLSDDIEGLSRRVIKAPTREISPSVQIVCLVEVESGLYTLADHNLIDLEMPLSYQQVQSCLRSTIQLNDKRVLNYFFNQAEDPPESFRKCAPLRWQYPIIFTNEQFETSEFRLHLDQERGLDVEMK